MAKKVKKFLPETHPHLLDEWDYIKNGNLQPEGVSKGSHERVWWLCRACSYGWVSTVCHRSAGRGCPACAGKVVTDKNRFSLLYPKIASEWNKEKNGLFIAENVSHGSNKKVWWKCNKCSHGWETSINGRCRGNGCPACSGNVVTDKNRLSILYPSIAQEWDHDKNELGPDKVSFGSERLVWWVCGKGGCGHSWKTQVSSRTRGIGCPVCSGWAVSDKNRLSILYPEVAEEWDEVKNVLRVEDVSYASNKKVWWLCKVCGYRWKSAIHNRSKGNGCPECAGKTVTDKNRLTLLFPGLVEEWDKVKNGKLLPEDVSYASAKIVSWVCKKCDYKWKSSVSNRTGGSCCPRCSKGNMSKVSQRWLDSLSVPVREYYISVLGIRVDGFDPETNTVYEFLGDYWHGNPEVKKFNPTKINSHSKKSFGDLYKKTMDRFRLLEKEGYKVVFIWENDFINNNR